MSGYAVEWFRYGLSWLVCGARLQIVKLNVVSEDIYQLLDLVDVKFLYGVLCKVADV